MVNCVENEGKVIFHDDWGKAMNPRNKRTGVNPTSQNPSDNGNIADTLINMQHSIVESISSRIDDLRTTGASDVNAIRTEITNYKLENNKEIASLNERITSVKSTIRTAVGILISIAVAIAGAFFYNIHRMGSIAVEVAEIRGWQNSIIINPEDTPENDQYLVERNSEYDYKIDYYVYDNIYLYCLSSFVAIELDEDSQQAIRFASAGLLFHIGAINVEMPISIVAGYNNSSLDDISNVNFVTSFEAGESIGGEIWLFGSLNDQGQWHGLMILNHFKNGELFALYEAEYKDGIRIGNYKHIIREINQYRIQNRTCYGTFTDGETLVYRNVTFSDMCIDHDAPIPIRFYDVERHDILSYFRGRIANSLFNDDTGRAIIISFTDEGFIRYLYNGHVVNGQPHDARLIDASALGNNAFRIALRYGYGETRYAFYEGVFASGSPRVRYPGVGHISFVDFNDERISMLLDSLDISPDLLRWVYSPG